VTLTGHETFSLGVSGKSHHLHSAVHRPVELWNFRSHVLSLPRAKVPGSENSTYGISSLLGAKVRGMWPIGDILLFVLFLAGATIAADAARPTSIVSTVLLQSWTEVKAQGFGNIRRERESTHNNGSLTGTEDSIIDTRKLRSRRAGALWL